MKKVKYSALALLALLAAFVALKLTHVIAWSWWWVFSPALAPLSIAAIFAAAVFIIVIAAPEYEEDDYE